MAGVVGNDGIHAIRGFLCDLCGRVCDPAAEELNALDCTYANCPKECAVYHQDCVERYLKSIRLEKNRKTGFRCPRGTGKGTKYADSPCPGKIDKSHPIHIRSDTSKKRRKAQLPPPSEPRAKPEPKAKAKPRAEEPAKPAAAAAAAPPKPAKPSKEEVQRLEKAKLQAAAAAMRRDMGLTSGAGPGPVRAAAPKPASRECQTLDEWEAARTGRPAAAAAVPNAWAAGSKPAAAAVAPSKAAAPAGKVPVAAAAAKLGPSLKLTRAADAERAPRVPVGGEAASPPAEEQRLTKAQRKNKRRAERKVLERESVASSELVSEQALDGAEPSPDSPEPSPAAAALEQAAAAPPADGSSEQPPPPRSPQRAATPPLPGDVWDAGVTAGVSAAVAPGDSLADDCAQALTLFRAQGLVGQLRALGFPEWQCVPAVVQHGADLDAAVCWMLEGHVASEEDARRLLGEESELPPIDVAPDLARLEALAGELRLDSRCLQQQVVTYEGDLEKACASLFEESLAGAGAAGEAAAAELAHAAAPEQPQSQQQQEGREWGAAGGNGGGGLQSEFMHLALSEPGGAGWQQQQQQQPISNGMQQELLLPSWGAAYAADPQPAAAAAGTLHSGALHSGALHSGAQHSGALHGGDGSQAAAMHAYGLPHVPAPSQARRGAPPGYAPPPAAALREPQQQQQQHWASQPAQEAGDLDIDNLLASLIAH